MVELEKQNFEKNKNLYSSVESRLKQLFDSHTPINHVGSTAIPQMYGKNIIDVLVGAEDKKEFETYKQILINEGYYASQNSKSDIYQFFASKQGETGSGDTHIHLVIIETERYKEFLILRDYLLSNEEEALAYSEHKKQLLNSGITDRKLYRNTKSEYVSKLIERAKLWAKI